MKLNDTMRRLPRLNRVARLIFDQVMSQTQKDSQDAPPQRHEPASQYDLSATLTLHDGQVVAARHIRPDDAERLVELFWQLSSETRWRRFFVPLDNVDAGLVQQTAQQLATIDRTRELALVAIRPEDDGEAVVGVARFAQSDQQDTAEAAIVVRDDFHGLGLGSQLFDLLIQAALARGLGRLLLFTQSDNTAMLKMVKQLGVPYTSNFSSGLQEISLKLGE